MAIAASFEAADRSFLVAVAAHQERCRWEEVHLGRRDKELGRLLAACGIDQELLREHLLKLALVASGVVLGTGRDNVRYQSDRLFISIGSARVSKSANRMALARSRQPIVHQPMRTRRPRTSRTSGPRTPKRAT